MIFGCGLMFFMTSISAIKSAKALFESEPARIFSDDHRLVMFHERERQRERERDLLIATGTIRHSPSQTSPNAFECG